MSDMRTPSDIDVAPIVNEEWWKKHVSYSKFRRQGIDITCASFVQSDPKANVVFVTGLMESFLKYSEFIQFMYEQGFNVFTYDHQSQGFSGRWLAETQSLWVNSFEDYVDDFVYFVTTISKEHLHLPMYLVAHSMGGLVASIAMSRLPTLVNRAVLCAPMLRNKCGMKVANYKAPLPQPLTYWITSFACYMGGGSMHALGYFLERPTDNLPLNVYTSDRGQLDKWLALRMKYPKNCIASCVTNDWVIHAIRACKKFAERYGFVKTNTLILSAETDYLVYNRAMAMFVKSAPSAKMFTIPGTYHELLQEQESARGAVYNVINDYFNQSSDDVTSVQPVFPLEEYDASVPIYSVPEMIIRGAGIALSCVGIIAGVAMLMSGSSKRRM